MVEVAEEEVGVFLSCPISVDAEGRTNPGFGVSLEEASDRKIAEAEFVEVGGKSESKETGIPEIRHVVVPDDVFDSSLTPLLFPTSTASGRGVFIRMAFCPLGIICRECARSWGSDVDAPVSAVAADPVTRTWVGRSLPGRVKLLVTVLSGVKLGAGESVKSTFVGRGFSGKLSDWRT